MAAAHVSGVAAMVLASRHLRRPARHPRQRQGHKPRVNGVAKRLRETARSLGLPQTQQGAGLIDAGRRDRAADAAPKR